MTGSDPAAVLTALAEPTRRQLLDLLAKRGEASASWLAESLPVTRQAIVKHLGVLDDAGLVTAERVGREVRYRTRSEALADTGRWMTELAAAWESRLAAIKRIAEAGDAPSDRADPSSGLQPR
jgi:DNA-binding transcriptional ArsR family regulator